MSQNISWLGANYTGVPFVTLPKSGGGTARFDDASVTTAVASDVTSGKIFVAADGTVTEGINSGGGGGTIQALTVTPTEETQVFKAIETVASLSSSQFSNVQGNNYWMQSVTKFDGALTDGKTYKVSGTVVNQSQDISIDIDGTLQFSWSQYGSYSYCIYPSDVRSITGSHASYLMNVEVVRNSSGNIYFTIIYSDSAKRDSGWTIVEPITFCEGLADSYVPVTVNPIPSQYIIPSGTKSISANGTGIDVAEYAAVDVAVPAPTPSLQAKTNIAPSTSSQTITADSGYDGLSSVQINAMPSGTAGTPTATKGTVSNHAVSVTPSVTNTTGYITGSTKTGTAVSVAASELVSGTLTISSSGTKDVTNYASASVAAGGATASATKGSVSNHSITVTPSVTRTAGYVTAGTSSGTAVTVSASELVSGSETKSVNGTYDVTNLASLVVAIPIVTYYTSSSNPTSSQGSNGDIWLVTS